MAPIARSQHVHSLMPLIAWRNALGATIVDLADLDRLYATVERQHGLY